MDPPWAGIISLSNGRRPPPPAPAIAAKHTAPGAVPSRDRKPVLPLLDSETPAPRRGFPFVQPVAEFIPPPCRFHDPVL